MMLAFSLFISMLTAGEPLLVSPISRTDLIDAYRAMVASLDGDQDGQISRAEWMETFSDARSPKADRAIPIRMALEAPPEDVFRDLDNDGDGSISFNELTRGPLANFDCLDADHDGIVQPAEGEAGNTLCAATPAPSRRRTAP